MNKIGSLVVSAVLCLVLRVFVEDFEWRECVE
jgi:hypothetical protein